MVLHFGAYRNRYGNQLAPRFDDDCGRCTRCRYATLFQKKYRRCEGYRQSS